MKKILTLLFLVIATLLNVYLYLFQIPKIHITESEYNTKIIQKLSSGTAICSEKVYGKLEGSLYKVGYDGGIRLRSVNGVFGVPVIEEPGSITIKFNGDKIKAKVYEMYHLDTLDTLSSVEIPRLCGFYVGCDEFYANVTPEGKLLELTFKSPKQGGDLLSEAELEKAANGFFDRYLCREIVGKTDKRSEYSLVSQRRDYQGDTFTFTYSKYIDGVRTAEEIKIVLFENGELLSVRNDFSYPLTYKDVMICDDGKLGDSVEEHIRTVYNATEKEYGEITDITISGEPLLYKSYYGKRAFVCDVDISLESGEAVSYQTITFVESASIGMRYPLVAAIAVEAVLVVVTVVVLILGKKKSKNYIS